MEKHVYIFKFLKSYGLLSLIFLIILSYFIIINFKDREGFELFHDECSAITCNNIKNKILFISGDYTS
mgnify:CR=1 FL=1